jgi:XTP/dITP diphosphohydrolase
MQIIVATRNKKKLREIKEIYRGLRFSFKSLADYPRAPRIIENGRTFKANAVKKALSMARFSGRLTLGEDSGLCVDALGGRPGVYSSRFAGRNKSDRQNNLKVLRLLKGLPLKKRKAHYVCAVALADKNGLLILSEGRCSGLIACQPKGNSGFGYDPLFLVPGYGKTFAELGASVKHRLSHRYRALSRAKKFLEKYVERRRAGCIIKTY